MSTPPKFQVPLDETKIHPEVAKHLRLVYDRIENHFTAIGNQQKQINDLKAQIAALQKGK